MSRFDQVANLYVKCLPDHLCLRGDGGFTASPEGRKAGAIPYLTGGTQSQNMGVSSVAIDWLQGTCPNEKMSEIFTLISGLVGACVHPVFSERGAMLFDCSAVWKNHGIAVYFDSQRNLDKNLHKGRFVVQFQGEFFHQRTVSEVMELFKNLRECWFKASRIDICFDDFKKIRKPYQVAKDAFKGCYAGFRSYQHIFTKKKNGDLTSDTVYFGKRGKTGSGKFLRVYDKSLESKGKINSIRWEVEWTKEKAFMVFGDLWTSCRCEREFVTKLGGIIAGSIAFMRFKSKNLDRNKNLYWWDKILKILGKKVVYPAPTRSTSLRKMVDHVEKSFPVTLATLEQVFGSDSFEKYLEIILETGRSRIDNNPAMSARLSFFKEVYNND